MKKKSDTKKAGVIPTRKFIPVIFGVLDYHSVPDGARENALYVLGFSQGKEALRAHLEIVDRTLTSALGTFAQEFQRAAQASPSRVLYGWNKFLVKDANARLTWSAWDKFLLDHFGRVPETGGRPEEFDKERAIAEITSLGATVCQRGKENSSAKPKSRKTVDEPRRTSDISE